MVYSWKKKGEKKMVNREFHFPKVILIVYERFPCTAFLTFLVNVIPLLQTGHPSFGGIFSLVSSDAFMAEKVTLSKT